MQKQHDLHSEKQALQVQNYLTRVGHVGTEL